MSYEIYEGQLMVYCYEISKGTKPVAVLVIKTKYTTEALGYIENEGLICSVRIMTKYPEWSSIYIYKDKYLEEIINNAPEEPNSVYDHWILGKLFGYSDAEIKKFITKLYDK